MPETFYVSGSKENLEQLAAALRENRFKGVELSAPRPAKGSLLSRAPLGQFGLFEILISVAANLASSAAYDGIKRVIGEFSQAGKVKLVTVSKPASTAKRTPGSARAKKKASSKPKATKKRSKK